MSEVGELMTTIANAIDKYDSMALRNNEEQLQLCKLRAAYADLLVHSAQQAIAQSVPTGDFVGDWVKRDELNKALEDNATTLVALISSVQNRVKALEELDGHGQTMTRDPELLQSEMEDYVREAIKKITGGFTPLSAYEPLLANYALLLGRVSELEKQPHPQTEAVYRRPLVSNGVIMVQGELPENGMISIRNFFEAYFNLVGLTTKQAASLCKSCGDYVKRAARAEAEDRELRIKGDVDAEKAHPEWPEIDGFQMNTHKAFKYDLGLRQEWLARRVHEWAVSPRGIELLVVAEMVPLPSTFSPSQFFQWKFRINVLAEKMEQEIFDKLLVSFTEYVEERADTHGRTTEGELLFIYSPGTLQQLENLLPEWWKGQFKDDIALAKLERRLSDYYLTPERIAKNNSSPKQESAEDLNV